MMPNLQTTLYGFEETLQFRIIKKTVQNHDLVETSKVKPPLWFEGVIQALHPRELAVKSEGERRFKWWTLFTDLSLSVDWVIEDENGFLYRVMSSTDWRQGGFLQYQLIEGPAS